MGATLGHYSYFRNASSETTLVKFIFFSGTKRVGPMMNISGEGQESGKRNLTINDANSQDSHIVQTLGLMSVWRIHKE